MTSDPYEAPDPAFATSVERVGEAVVVRVDGEIDVATADRFERDVVAVLGRPLLVLDLTGVRFLGSTGLTRLVELRRRAEEAGTALRLVVAGNRTVWRPLEATGLLAVFALSDSVEEATR